MQAAHYGISLWHPFTGQGAISPAPLPFRTGIGSHMSLAMKFDDPAVMQQAKTRLAEFLPLRRHLAADFYPLTDYTLAADAWIAWQHHAPKPAKASSNSSAAPRPRASRSPSASAGSTPPRGIN